MCGRSSSATSSSPFLSSSSPSENNPPSTAASAAHAPSRSASTLYLHALGSSLVSGLPPTPRSSLLSRSVPGVAAGSAIAPLCYLSSVPSWVPLPGGSDCTSEQGNVQAVKYVMRDFPAVYHVRIQRFTDFYVRGSEILLNVCSQLDKEGSFPSRSKALVKKRFTARSQSSTIFLPETYLQKWTSPTCAASPCLLLPRELQHQPAGCGHRRLPLEKLYLCERRLSPLLRLP